SGLTLHMTPIFVYLAGPITGCTEGQANDWRDHVSQRLAEIGMVGVSPLRCEPIHGETYDFEYDQDPCFGTWEAIAAKNMEDVQRCDVTLAYIPTKFASDGTLIELGWAKALGKRTILVSTDPKVFKHPPTKS